MTPIPFIGTAVVKNPFWVRRLVTSIDHPVEHVCIVNNNGLGEITAELDEISRWKHPMIGKISVVHMPANIGASGAWNLMIKCYMKCPYWIIANDDIAFGPGFLKEMNDAALSDPEVGLIHGHSGDYGVGSWDLFLLLDHIVSKFGLFDENLYPAYNEDADYIMRFVHRPIKKIMSLTSQYFHGFGTKEEYYTHGSQTKKSSPELRAKLDEVNLRNIEYMTRKWGPDWRQCNPSPKPALPLSSVASTSYDLDFVRTKHLGF